LTPEVVKWNLDWLIKNKIDSYVDATSVDVLGNNKIRINIGTWSNSLLTTMAYTRITSKAAYDAHGEDYVRWHPVGTGPFKLESLTPNVSLKAVRFDDYWQKPKPYLDAVIIDSVFDPMTRASSFAAGEYDVTGGDLSKVEYDLKQKGYNVSPVVLASNILVPDSKNANSPLSILKVRQAIDYAINRDEIVKTLGYGWWTTTYQFAVPGQSCYINDLQPRKYDLEKAKQLMQEAGKSSGFTIKMLGNSILSNKDVLVAIQGYLSKINITVDLNMVDNGTFWTLNMQGWEGFCTSGRMIGADMNMANDGAFLQTSPSNASMAKPDELQALLKAATASAQNDPILTKKVIQYVFDNAVIIPLYGQTRGEVIQPYVRDLGLHNQILAMFWAPENAWLDK